MTNKSKKKIIEAWIVRKTGSKKIIAIFGLQIGGFFSGSDIETLSEIEVVSCQIIINNPAPGLKRGRR